MKLGNISVVFRKELLDITRDRRTLMFMVFLPLLAIPLLMMVVGKVGESSVRKMIDRPSHVAILGKENAPEDLIGLFNHMGIRIA